MALLSGAARDNLPDSDFAYIEPGGSKDSSGKTVPRSKRHFPIQNAEHVRDALARIGGGAQFGTEALPKVRAAAKRFGIDDKSSGGHEVKSFALKLESPPDDEGRFTGYAAVFGNVDKGNDLIEPGAFKKSLQENPQVPILWAHDSSEPIGVSTYMAEDGKGLKVEGQLAMDVQRAREVHALMKLGALKGISIGYNTVKRRFQGSVRHLQEVAVGEFSPVVFPMNTSAQVDGVKDSKFLGQYESTQSVDCVLSIIGDLTDYLASEVEKGDADDAARVRQILPIISQCLESEIADVATGESTNDDAEDDSPYGMMSAAVERSIKTLTALCAGEPANATRTVGAADDAAEPVSTLRALMADIKSAA